MILVLLLLPGSGFAAEKFFGVHAKKFSYTPHIITVKKGDIVTIRLKSVDVAHGLFLDGYEINTAAHPGQDGYLKFVADQSGRFSFRCSVACGEFHPYMIGHLVVEPNLRFFTYVILTGAVGLISLLVIFWRRER